MSRPPRDQRPGCRHVGGKGNNGRALYLDDDDRSLYLRLLQLTARRFDWRLHLWCLMTTHVHLLIETKEENLAVGMHLLNSVYAHEFNARHGSTGHLFERRYWSKVITTDEQLRQTALYVIYNPVAAGLCREPSDWPWTGGAMFFAALRS